MLPRLALSLLLPLLCRSAAADELPAPPDPVFRISVDRADVRAADLPRVELHCRYAAAHPATQLLISGHTDRHGGREFNFAIGQKRAEALRNRLQACGVPPDRMEAVSFGREHLADPRPQRAADAINRRVEISYRQADVPAAPRP